jgi:hypothetical protein
LKRQSLSIYIISQTPAKNGVKAKAVSKRRTGCKANKRGNKKRQDEKKNDTEKEAQGVHYERAGSKTGQRQEEKDGP